MDIDFLIFVLLFLFMPIMVYGLYCIYKMYINVADGRIRLAALLPMGLFDSSLYNDIGNKYRKRVLGINLVGLVIFLPLMLIK